MFKDYTTRKDRMTKKKAPKMKQKITKEKWYDGKVYLHIPLVPFKIRIA
jgi:hypothetical protein